MHACAACVALFQFTCPMLILQVMQSSLLPFQLFKNKPQVNKYIIFMLLVEYVETTWKEQRLYVRRGVTHSNKSQEGHPLSLIIEIN